MTQERNKKENEIIDNIDRAINELVYEKTKLMKAYNYYHGRRDPEQFRHLEENYGIGTPTSVEFVPLVRKHIDVLIGEYLSTVVLPKISCKDDTTLSAIHRDKQLAINQAVVQELNKFLKNSIYSAIKGEEMNDPDIEARIKDLQDAADLNFISDYEIAGQNIVEHAMQSRNIDFANKRKILLTDLLVAGTIYFKVCPTASKTGTDLRVLNPINTFIDRNPNSPYLKDSARSVIREYLTKQQILSKYGEFLTKDDLENLETVEGFDSEAPVYVRGYETTSSGIVSEGILGGFEVTPILPFERTTSKHFRLFPVYEVEWLEAEKEDGTFITNRYEGVRIGTNIYITTGKVEESVVRTMDDPRSCTLSINGMFYSDRNGDPFSLVVSTANLQD